MANLDALTKKVQETTTVEASITALIQGLSQQIKDAGADQAKIDALTASLDAGLVPMTAAVLAGTPSAPTAPTTPAPAVPPPAPTTPTT